MKYEEALSILEKAININPNYSEFYYLQGIIIKYVENDIKCANTVFKRFFDLNVMLKLDVEKISFGKESVERYQSYEFSLQIIDEQLSKVILDLEEIIKRYDYYADAYIDLIQICNKHKKNIEKAKDYYKKLVEMYPFFKKEDNLFLMKKINRLTNCSVELIRDNWKPKTL